MVKKLWIAMLGLAIILGACVSSKDAGNTVENAVDSALAGLEWNLLSVKAVNSNDLIIPSPDKRPTLMFNAEKKSISGFGGCNRLMGAFELKGTSLKLANVASTMMMCEEHMDIENAVKNALQQTDSYKIVEGQLVLMKANAVLATYSLNKMR